MCLLCVLYEGVQVPGKDRWANELQARRPTPRYRLTNTYTHNWPSEWLVWLTVRHTYNHGDRRTNRRTDRHEWCRQTGLCRMLLARLVQTWSDTLGICAKKGERLYYVHFNYRLSSSWICMRQTLPTHYVWIPLTLLLQQFMTPSGV